MSEKQEKHLEDDEKKIIAKLFSRFIVGGNRAAYLMAMVTFAKLAIERGIPGLREQFRANGEWYRLTLEKIPHKPR